MVDKKNSRELKANSDTIASETTEITPAEIESIEKEVGLTEVDVDPEELQTVAADLGEDITEDDLELDRDNVSTEYNPSYGTGLQGESINRAGREVSDFPNDSFNQANSELTGGDLDANYEQANAVGDEAVGGTAPTPDQDVVDEIGAAVGLEMRDRSSLRTNEILEHRDEDRWETDPESAEDYETRQEDY